MARKRRGGVGGSQVGPGTVVEISYELYDADGELAGVALPTAPLEFLFGYGQLAPTLERALAGMVSGQARRVLLEPEDAFGRRDPKALIEVDRDELPPDVAVGDELDAEEESAGGLVRLKVIEIADTVVLLDTNHPLAGQTVEIDVLVESVRPAGSAELEAAEALLSARNTQTLIPAARLLKRGVRESPPDGDGVA